jgi:hypothetical protein
MIRGRSHPRHDAVLRSGGYRESHARTALRGNPTRRDAHKIEQDDLSLPDKQALLAEREKLARRQAQQRSRCWCPRTRTSLPFLLTGRSAKSRSSRCVLLKERAQWKPLRGKWRVFLIDGIDRAFEQSANSLLKTLEEPPSASDPDHDRAEPLRFASDDPFASASISAHALWVTKRCAPFAHRPPPFRCRAAAGARRRESGHGRRVGSRSPTTVGVRPC